MDFERVKEKIIKKKTHTETNEDQNSQNSSIYRFYIVVCLAA